MKKYKIDKGFALISVLITLLVLSILGVALLTVSSTENSFAVHQDKKTQAYFLAHSGADATAKYLIRNPSMVSKLLGTTSIPNTHFPNGNFEVSVDSAVNTGEVVVASSAVVGSVPSSVKTVLSSYPSSLILSKAIYTTNELDITNVNVTGDVQSGGDINLRETGSNKFEGEAFRNQPMYYGLNPFPSPPGMADITVEAHHTEEISGTGYSISTVTIDNDGVLVLDPHGSVMKMVINQMFIKGTLKVDDSYGGRVELYITDLMEIQTGGLINNTYPYNLFIFIQDGKTFDMQAGMELNGYVIGPNASIILQSNNSVINGAVIGNILKKNSTDNGGNGTVNYYPVPSSVDISSSVSGYKIVRWEKN